MLVDMAKLIASDQYGPVSRRIVYRGNLDYIDEELEKHGDQEIVRQSSMQLYNRACKEEGDEIPSIVSSRSTPDGWRITRSEAERQFAAYKAQRGERSASQTLGHARNHEQNDVTTSGPCAMVTRPSSIRGTFTRRSNTTKSNVSTLPGDANPFDVDAPNVGDETILNSRQQPIPSHKPRPLASSPRPDLFGIRASKKRGREARGDDFGMVPAAERPDKRYSFRPTKARKIRAELERIGSTSQPALME